MLDSLTVGQWYDRTVRRNEWEEGERNALMDHVWAVQRRRPVELHDLHGLLRELRSKRSNSAPSGWQVQRVRVQKRWIAYWILAAVFGFSAVASFWDMQGSHAAALTLFWLIVFALAAWLMRGLRVVEFCVGAVAIWAVGVAFIAVLPGPTSRR